MRILVDTLDLKTVYADLRPEEELDLPAAQDKAEKLGRDHLEIWRTVEGQAIGQWTQIWKKSDGVWIKIKERS